MLICLEVNFAQMYKYIFRLMIFILLKNEIPFPFGWYFKKIKIPKLSTSGRLETHQRIYSHKRTYLTFLYYHLYFMCLNLRLMFFSIYDPKGNKVKILQNTQ